MRKDDNDNEIQPQASTTYDLREQLLSKNSVDEVKQNQNAGSQHENKKQKSDQKNKKIKEKYEIKNNVLKGRNFFSKMFFMWISAFADFGNYFQVTKQNVPILPEDQKPKIEFDKLYNLLKTQKKSDRQGVLLAKCIAKCYRTQFLWVFFQTIFFVGFSMYAPIITDQIITYIEDGPANERSTSKGLTLFIGVFLLTLFKLIAQSHVYYNFGILGYNLSNTLSLMLYEKSLKHPVLCLKKYSVSEIINYSQVDAQRMTYMGFQLTALIFTPLQVILGLWLMYNFIGISFLSGIGVMILTITLTFVFSKISIKANENVLKAKDERMKVTQEIFSIIRFIKINAFEKYFWQKLNKKRQQQIKLNKRKLLYEVLQIFLYWLASPLILSMTFATFTWLGGEMSATEAFTTIMLFRILQYPIRLLPTAISEVIQIWTSLKRIEKFLVAEQIQYDTIKVGNQKDHFAVKITNGTFAWAKEKKTDKEKEKQKEKESKSDDKAQGSKSPRSPKKLKNKQQKLLESVLTQQLSDDSDQERSSMASSGLQQSVLSVRHYNQIKKEDSQQSRFIKALKDLHIEIYSGTFTMVIGDIGSGKSSFLFSILNEMKASKKSMIQINGSIAYVPQKPWIMSGSLRENITFTLPYQKEKFDEAIKYASMKTDLGLLINGQLTEIGEKGANLSGGQKARIGLARALYSDRDIYLLDDIISAVDVHVGDYLMKQTILKHLRNKTVIMPTHAVKFAEYADKIIIMKKGRIVKVGSFNDIKDSEQFKSIRLQQKSSKKQSNSKSPKDEQQLIEDLKKIKSVQEQKKNKMKSFHVAEQAGPQTITDQIVEQLIMPQDKVKGSIGWTIYKNYIDLNGGIKFLIILTICMCGWLGFTTVSNVWMQKWCESEDKQHSYYLYVFLVLSITSSVFMLIRAYTLVIGGIKCGSTVHKKITKALLYASLAKFYNRVPQGRIMNRLSKDMREVDETIGYAVGSFIASFFGLLGTLIICVYGSTYLIIVPMILVLYLSNRIRIYYMATQRQCVRLENITSSPIVSGFLSTVNGIDTIRAYNLQEKFLEKQIERIEINKRLRITREALESWYCQRLSFISFFVNMTAIAYCMFSENENSSLAGLLLTYALTLADDIIDTMFCFTSLESKMVSVERVNNFMQIQPEQGYKKYTQNWRTKQEGYNKDVITKGEIQFVDTKVRYRPQLPLVLKGLNLRINKGQKIGIVGRTGAGKSTIINCLLRILECSSGKILIDGKDIKKIFLKDLRSNITMIDQQPVMINGSFRQNLDPLKIYTDQELVNIVKECNLYDVVEEKGGLDSRVTNDSLSVGEKQLLCICRAFLKKSQIVLVDEATANIDQKNDNLIQEVIQNKFKQSTVLTIAHRLSTLKNSDKILVMGEGKVIQWGSPTQLMQKDGGIYRDMCIKGNLTQEYLI